MGVHSVLCSWCPSVCGKDKLLGHTASVMSFDHELQLEKIVNRHCKPEPAMVTHSYNPCTRETEGEISAFKARVKEDWHTK